MQATRLFFISAAAFPILASSLFAQSLTGPSHTRSERKQLIQTALDRSAGPEARCEALASLERSGGRSVSRAQLEALSDPDPRVQACAARSAGASGNELAIDALVNNVENYLAAASVKGPYEDNLRDRLKAIDSIWALGEIGSPEVMSKLREFYSSADAVLRVNIAISVGKLGPNPHSAPFLKAIAITKHEAGAVRAAAFEMLEERGEEASLPGISASPDGIEKGDIIYTGGIVGTIGSWGTSDLPVGHAGIFAGTESDGSRIRVLIADCVPNDFIPPGVRDINSWKNFTHHYKYPYYGNRTTKEAPSASQRDAIVRLALEMGTRGLKYNGSHFSQKGPEEFDCVGYTEYIYEQAGLNPTENRYESGLGWPLSLVLAGLAIMGVGYYAVRLNKKYLSQ